MGGRLSIVQDELDANSNCDSVLLEHDLALELYDHIQDGGTIRAHIPQHFTSRLHVLQPWQRFGCHPHECGVIAK